MKLRNLSIQNFGSWKDLKLNLNGLGLTSVSGVTGSGKSGIADAVAWILYGETSKDGASDDVRSWGEEEPTTGYLEVDTPAGCIEIYRTRGTASENDLYWDEDGSGQTNRGKNLVDTQKLLNKRLGVTPELFFTASYFHQFSKADTFFIAKAQDRREIFEKIVDQDLAVTLGERASEARKETKKLLEAENRALAALEGKHQGLLDQSMVISQNSSLHEEKRQNEIKYLESKAQGFEDEKNRQQESLTLKISAFELQVIPPKYFSEYETEIQASIERLDSFTAACLAVREQTKEVELAEAEVLEFTKLVDLSECPTCAGEVSPDRCGVKLEQLKTNLAEKREILAFLIQDKENMLFVMGKDEIYQSQQQLKVEASSNEQLLSFIDKEKLKLETVIKSENKYIEQLERVKNAENPYEAQIINLVAATEETSIKLVAQTAKIAALDHKLILLNLTYDASFQLRGVLLSKVITEIETSTNNYLSKYFDADIKVTFNLESGDKLEVLVSNNGNSCGFRQLSGGERCLLKLAFNLSIMQAAANKAGVKFNCLFLDEILNGLSDDLKMKAFGLLQELTGDYDSVLVIEHCPAFVQEFDKVIRVDKIGDRSEMSYE